MTTLPIKATLRFNRWEELHWKLVWFLNNDKSVIFDYKSDTGGYISSFSMNPWQYRVWIIDWEEIKSEHLLNHLNK